ncbi:MAG: hypothetical protein LUQ33_08295 [Methanoregulaceae archaeon]|nr:hypothetical protein [Methanoregulaceae archaeon]
MPFERQNADTSDILHAGDPISLYAGEILITLDGYCFSLTDKMFRSDRIKAMAIMPFFSERTDS